ncbi:syntaxin-81 [Raphanus sativus]|uniref:Syntaxin-81 n=1 Tax=Raphanus sativus TaxID=3726 RepID=A0A6J0NVF7_RAPSA|nr:syntaxin-81 [Raphanus sativus]
MELDQFMMKHRKEYVDLHQTTEQVKDSIEQQKTQEDNSILDTTLANPEPIEPDETQAQPCRVQKQQLLEQVLQKEPRNLLDGARQTETKMVEMSALNHLMATPVLQQAKQIEFLYDQDSSEVHAFV